MIRWGSLLIYVVVFLPPGLFTVANTSSMAAGAALACLLAILVRPRPALASLFGPRTEVGLPLLLGVAVVVHAMIVGSFLSLDIGRALSSFALAALFLLGARTVSEAFFERQSPAAVDATCLRVLQIMALILPVALLELIPSDLFGRNRIIFPFSEPSVFALALMPFLAYTAIRLRGWKRLALMLGAFAAAAVVQNLTMIIGLILVASICMRFRLLLVLLALVVAGGSFLDLTYFASRLPLDSESENLSTLVYIQGWQLVEESMRASFGWGIGFQQLGVRPTSVPAASLIYEIGGVELNLNDGGFVLAKLLSEFGVFGVAAAALIGKMMHSHAMQLRHAATHAFGAPSLVLARCVVVCFGVDILVRGAGYFSGTSLLFLASVQFLHRAGLRRKQKRVSVILPFDGLPSASR